MDKQGLSEITRKVKEILGYFADAKDPVTPDYEDGDTQYMSSLSAAIAEGQTHFPQRLVIIIALALVAFLIWAGLSELDTTVRAAGKVIPSSQVQKIQSLEGGVVSEILVDEGDHVEINQPLMKISDISFHGSFEENRIRYLELKARLVRLRAEADLSEFGTDETVAAAMPHLLESEKKLFDSNKAELLEGVNMLEEQVKQAENQLREAQAKQKQMVRNHALIQKELEITRPLVERRVVSEVEYLQLKGKESDVVGELERLSFSIPRLKSMIDESRQKIEYSQIEFKGNALKELNEIEGEVSRLEEIQRALADRVARTVLRSPVNGTVKQIFSNTVGGVIQSGGNIMEVVPKEDSLLVEVRIKPADIAHIEVGHPCRIKFTAYDFAIHGSVSGRLSYISADTITDDDGISFYVARVVPDRTFLGHPDRPLPIKIGMTAEVDVITGKNTILNYLLKPIRRAIDTAMTEA